MRILDWHINNNMARQHGVSACIAAMGLIPEFLSPDDIRPAWEQINDRYAHGGGWNAMLPGKWQLDQDNNLLYPGDPPLQPIAMARLRDEIITIHEHAFVCITQLDGSFSVARLD